MIHNKDFEILKEFLGDYKKEIHGRSLVGKVGMSQKAIALALESLEKNGVLRHRKQGNMKLFSINLSNKRAKDTITMMEIRNKSGFLIKHPKLSEILAQDDRIVGVFGSYARGSQKKDSDIDFFIIGRKKKNDYSSKGRLFDLEISIRYFPEKQFISLLRTGNTLVKEIIENHVIIFGAERFVDIVWGHHGIN